jgi:hypothetical protein
MVKSRLYQILYRSFELAMGIIGVLVSIRVISTGASQSDGNPTFYYFFTNLSNYAVTLYVLAELIFDIIRFRKGEKIGTRSLCLGLKFSLVIAISLTMLVANIMLGFMMPSMGFIFEARWWTWLTNPFLHFFNPLFFILDFCLFSEVGQCKKSYPFYSLIGPLLYVTVILIRGAIVTQQYGPSDENIFYYPYPFLNPTVSSLGYWWVFLWCLGLVAFFIGYGFLFVYLDKKRGRKELKEEK